ncbi:MAG: hypothetical protein ACYDBW_10260 [Sulfuricaulis sp.]
MTLTELKKLIESHGLYPIQVDGEATDDEHDEFLFSGTIEEYFKATKVLNATAVFTFVSTLEEGDFLHEVKLYENGKESEESYEEDQPEQFETEMEVDLTVALPSLSQFKQHLGKECAFRLLAIGERATLSFYLEEDWWHQFLEECYKAIDKVEEDREAIRRKIAKQQADNEKELMKLVKNLINDNEFVRIPTQRGMKVYALEKYPQLNEMNDVSLSQEIQLLSDKVKAKGLNKKRRWSYQ